jgi:phosphate/sulfate permease
VGISFGVGCGAMVAVALAMPPLTQRITVLLEQKSLEEKGASAGVKGDAAKGGGEDGGEGRDKGQGGGKFGGGGGFLGLGEGEFGAPEEYSFKGEKRGGVDANEEKRRRMEMDGAPADERSIVLTMGERFTESLNHGGVMQSRCNTEEVVKSSGAEVQAIHDNAEVFDDKSELVFGYMQVFSACCDSFAHGANDVANAMGPFAAIWGIYEHGIADKSEVPLWVLVIGGLGMVAGLWMYGAKIIMQIGMRLSKITPSRGLCIELGAAIVVIVGTKFGIPLSTTHCQVGATTGVVGLYKLN